MALAYKPVPGVRLGVAAAGIKDPERDDLLLIELAEGATCAGVFTRNAFRAAPVLLAQEHLAGSPRYLLVNAGNANAGTGEQGLRDARQCCEHLAALAGCRTDQVLPFSTGVIGVNLPVARIAQALPLAIERLDEANWEAAARAMMTTDTREKLRSRQFEVEGVSVTVTGMAKGSGMICPDMATMLAFVATDLQVDAALLRECLAQAMEPSFNSITVDGDTSTNDACMLMATGTSSLAPLQDAASPVFRRLCEAVTDVCMQLAREIVRDGEGATKLVQIQVEQGRDSAEARQVAYTVAHSPLVKTALFAADPNWGRILAAVGRAGLSDLAIERVRLWLDDVCIVRDGARAADYTEVAGKLVMDQPEFTVRIELGRGTAQTRVLTCDLSYDYVRINAEYRT